MFLTLDSRNSKIGPSAATYAPIEQTCPSSCSLKDNGCYAQSGRVALHNRHLEQSCLDLSGNTVAVLEADEIRDAAAKLTRSRQSRPLRLHASGDAATSFAARTLSAAASRWPGPVWTYTHAWRDVAREDWRDVSVLASCETSTDAKLALAAGYAPALVVQEHPADGRAYELDGMKIIPCPEQTRGIPCVECGLCLDDTALKARRAVVAFAAHGGGRKRVLTVIA